MESVRSMTPQEREQAFDLQVRQMIAMYGYERTLEMLALGKQLSGTFNKTTQ